MTLHTVAKLRTSITARVGIMMLAASVSAFAAPGAVAQSSASDKSRAAAAEKGQLPATDKVIISNMPQRKSGIYALLAKALGKTEGEKLGHTQSEVWSVPQSRLGRLVQRLKGLGCKVTRVRPDSNHILKRHQGRW